MKTVQVHSIIWATSVTERTENEIWVHLNASQKKADLQVANIQQNLQKNCCRYCTNSK